MVARRIGIAVHRSCKDALSELSGGHTDTVYRKGVASGKAGHAAANCGSCISEVLILTIFLRQNEMGAIRYWDIFRAVRMIHPLAQAIPKDRGQWLGRCDERDDRPAKAEEEVLRSGLRADPLRWTGDGRKDDGKAEAYKKAGETTEERVAAMQSGAACRFEETETPTGWDLLIAAVSDGCSLQSGCGLEVPD